MTKFQNTNNINHTDFLKIEMEARMARAEVFVKMISSVAKVFSKVSTWIFEKIEISNQRNHFYALDDRLLKDIGITRDQIDGIGHSTLFSQATSGLISQSSSFIVNLLAGLTTWVSKRTKHQSLRNELNSLSEHELSDIGISRGDIEDIVAGIYVNRRTGLDTTNVKVLKQLKTTDNQKPNDDTSIAA